MYQVIKKISDACALQWIVSAASLPFLLWWHIPFPLLSILGNLLHPLFLTGFLCISSALFFATLLNVPTHLLAWLLTLLTNTWDALFSLNIDSCWITLRWWHLIPTLSIAIMLLCLNLLKPIMPYKRTIFLFIALLNSSTALWQLNAKQKSGITILHKGKKHLVCIPHNDYIELIDFGFISNARNKESIMAYEVMPHILFYYGIGRILNMIVHPT
jgi:hypothetical protein